MWFANRYPRPEARALFRRSAKEARWRAIESLTLLELAQTVGLELP
jgi:hypothetical protein